MRIMKTVALLIFIGFNIIGQSVSSQTLNEVAVKIARTLNLINSHYVDTVDINSLAEKAIIEILKNLDPHSVYISAEDVKEMNEPLLGNFEGIGIQFNLLHDTIIVIEPVSGGPSEKIGLLSGDRIITIDDEKVAGTGITTNGVRKRLMGPKGTRVDLKVFRKGEKEILDFAIIRDKIPINSLDAAYMLNKETGYIKLNKFAATTEQEFRDAVERLQKEGMKNIMLDLRGNGGGYMMAATALADEFFDAEKLLVYMSGRKTNRHDYKSNGTGTLSSSRVAVLTDEGSASASEIFAGALQDWDRGIVVGRRTFGKGLVQNPFYLTDGSMIRLTIARYYTPTGRSIQSPYDEGYDKYLANFYRRYTGGEMMNADSIHFPDSLRFTTMVNKRTVYGGGGIMPDVFVPADTSGYSGYYRNLVRKGILNSFALEYFDINRNRFNSDFEDFDYFEKKFEFKPYEIQALIMKGESDGVPYEEAQFKKSEAQIIKILKALIASNLWKTNEYYFRILNKDDVVIETALNILSDRTAYDKILDN